MAPVGQVLTHMGTMPAPTRSMHMSHLVSMPVFSSFGNESAPSVTPW